MLDLEPEIRAEFDRVLRRLPDVDTNLGPSCLTIREILEAHFLIANRFYLEGEGLGGIGPRDDNLLLSAAFRQNASFGGVDRWETKFERCATLFFGLAKNHAFHDANKRTAFLCALFQLEKMEWCPSVSQSEFEDFTVDVADNQLSKYARYKEYVKNEDADPEIRYIAWYLRNNIRKIDRQHYAITFRELRAILNRFGYDLRNPFRNYVDVVKVAQSRAFLGLLGPKREVVTKVGHIGMPRWTAQVSKGDVKLVRQWTNLRADDGVDSGAFYHGLGSMQSLITSYNEPLRRLAHR